MNLWHTVRSLTVTRHPQHYLGSIPMQPSVGTLPKPPLLFMRYRMCASGENDSEMLPEKHPDPLLKELKYALSNDAVRAREIASQFGLPSSDTAMWVNSFLALPWTIKGENYFWYPIGQEIFEWIKMGNADQLQGSHYINFTRALNCSFTRETTDFIFDTISPEIISRMWPESMCHFLWLLSIHMKKDAIPQGLKNCISIQMSENWRKIHFSHIGMLPHHGRRLRYFFRCLNHAADLGIGLRDIVGRNVVSMGYLLSVFYIEMMALLECFLIDDNSFRGVPHEESLDFQRAALRRAGIMRALPEDISPRLRSIIESKDDAKLMLLEPWVVEELLDIFSEAHRTEQNPSLKSLLNQSCLQLVEILAIYHIQHKLQTIWPGHCPGLKKWSGWGMFAVFPIHDPGAGRILYPIVRLLAHNCFAMQRCTSVDNATPAPLAIINGLVEFLWQISDVHELLYIEGIFRDQMKSMVAPHTHCQSQENAANFRHIYSNNRKAVEIHVNNGDVWRFPYLRWTGPDLMLVVQRKKHLMKFPAIQAERMRNLAATLSFCLTGIAHDLLVDNPLQWHVYLFLHPQRAISTKSDTTGQLFGDSARQWLSTLKKPSALIHALRDGLRAGLLEDIMVQSLFTKLRQLSVNIYSFDELWKLCVLQIHVSQRSGYKDLPKNFLFSIFNKCYDTLQDTKEISKYAKILPDIIFLLSHLKLNKLTLAKLTEMCHLMMHHSLRVSSTCASLSKAFSHLVMPPVAHDSCENVISGRILPYIGNGNANPVWLDKVQVQKFIERSIEQLRNDDASEHSNRCQAHKVSDIINLCELCILLRHNSAATDDLIYYASTYSSAAIDVEICRLVLAFGKPGVDEIGKKLQSSLTAQETKVFTDGILCESSQYLRLNNLLPLLASLIRYTKRKDQNLLVLTLRAILKNINKATPEELRFMLDLLRSESPVLGSKLERSHFIDVQQRVLREVSTRIRNHEATIEIVLDVVLWHIGTAETCFDSEMNHCLGWISSFLLDENRPKRVEHLVAITRMMAKCGYRHEFILRRSVDMFMSLPTTNSYHVTSILSSLRKLDIHDIYDRSESIELVKGIYKKLRAFPSLSGRLIASVLTSLSVLIQMTIGTSADVDNCISQLFQVFSASLHKEAPTMDCITISAILLACARLNLKDFPMVFSRLFERSAFLDWAKYPTQAVHFILATVEIDPTQEILVYLLFSEEVAVAIRCILDHPSSYKNLHSALRLIKCRIPSLNLFDSPLAKLTLISIEGENDHVEIDQSDPIDEPQWDLE